MKTTELTDQQRQAIQAEPGMPVDVVDPATKQAYVIVAREQYEQYERMRMLLGERPPTTTPVCPAGMTPLMLQSQRAFWHDLSELLTLKSRKRRWVAYHGDVRIGFGRTDTELYQECFRRGLRRGEFYVGFLEPLETPPWGPSVIEESLYECSDGPLPDDPIPAS
jgi:hypothetical protein